MKLTFDGMEHLVDREWIDELKRRLDADPNWVRKYTKAEIMQIAGAHIERLNSEIGKATGAFILLNDALQRVPADDYSSG